VHSRWVHALLLLCWRSSPAQERQPLRAGHMGMQAM
jgi:hypothetical protein